MSIGVRFSRSVALPATLVLFIPGLIAACGSSTASGASSTTAAKTTTTVLGGTAATPVATGAAITQAKWASNESVTTSGSTIKIASDSLPSTTFFTRPSTYAVPNTGVIVPSASTAHIASDPTVSTPISISVPTTPKWSTTTTAASLGPIGITVSGAPLYDPYEGNGTTVALSHNFTISDSTGRSASFVDSCFGHPTPMGAYHYHGKPVCVTDKVDGTTGPSHLIGVALDGYPIYGDRATSGSAIKSSSLDRCNGIYSATPEFPHGIYHYVLTDLKTAQSAPRCFHGTVTGSLAAFHSARYICGSIGAGSHLMVAATGRFSYDWRRPTSLLAR